MSPQDPVRVLVVSPATPVWGAQIVLLDLAAALAEHDIELTLGSVASSPFAVEWTRRGHPFLELDIRSHGGLRRGGTDARPRPVEFVRLGGDVVRQVDAIRRSAKDFDAVFSSALRVHVSVAVAGRVARVPSILDLVDIVRPGLGQRVLRSAARLADLTLANSSATAAALRTAGPVVVVHPGVDLDRFGCGPTDDGVRSDLGRGRSGPLIGIAGRLDEEKGVQVVVEAMTLLRGQAADAQLVVVGEAGTGPTGFADRLRLDAERLLGDRVNFVGRRADMPEVMRALDVLVVASRSEPFGLTALEAQVSRTPVIGTNAGGLPEFVEHEVTGLLVPPFEPAALARAIERIFDEPDLTKSMVDEAERRAIPARGVAAQRERIAQVFRAVASGVPVV
jgi:glycosyltransferase involved in cell wall biosynthesis